MKKISPIVIAVVIALLIGVVVAMDRSSESASTSDSRKPSTSQTGQSDTAETAAGDTPAPGTSSVTTPDENFNRTTRSGRAIPPFVEQFARNINRGDIAMTNPNRPQTQTAASVTPATAPVAPAQGGSSSVTPPAVTMPPPPPPIATPIDGNLVPNPSLEDSNNGVPTGWTFGYYNTTASGSYDAVGFDGSHSLKIEVTAQDAVDPGDAKWLSSEFPVTAGKTYQIGDTYKANGASQMDVIFKGAGLPDLYSWVGDAAAAAEWVEFKGQFTIPAGYTSAVVFHAITSVGSLSTDKYYVIESTTTPTTPPAPAIPVVDTFSRALVSLTFDDGWKSIHINGLPLLQKYGMVSTQYLLSGIADNPEYMDIEDMRDFQATGHEIAAHTVHHCDLTGQQTDDPINCPIPTNPAKVQSELVENKADLETDFDTVVRNFATPYGAYNDSVLQAVKDAGFTSHRTVQEGYNTLTDFDPYNIKVQNIRNTTTPQQVQAWVNEAIASRSWLVLVYHQVDTGNDQYAVTPANLDTELAAIKASGIKVATVAEALAEITPQLPAR